MGVCIEDVDTPAVETLGLQRASVPRCKTMGHHGRRQGARSMPHGRLQGGSIKNPKERLRGASTHKPNAWSRSVLRRADPDQLLYSTHLAS